MGANIYGGGSEAEYAEIVLQKAQEMLVSSTVVIPVVSVDPAGETVKIIVNDKLVYSQKMASIKAMSWKDFEKKLYRF